MIELRDVTRNNLDAVLALQVGSTQHNYVASNERSLAQAFFHQDVAWFRAIYAAGEPIGFVMTSTLPGEPPNLWRLMIDEAHQGHGYGRAALELLSLRLAAEGHQELVTSCVPDEGGPLPFYLALGFEQTGEVDEDGEVILKACLVQR
jgi:diamine N-acetyltransferase